jgi:hypothetical protein
VSLAGRENVAQNRVVRNPQWSRWLKRDGWVWQEHQWVRPDGYGPRMCWCLVKPWDHHGSVEAIQASVGVRVTGAESRYLTAGAEDFPLTREGAVAAAEWAEMMLHRLREMAAGLDGGAAPEPALAAGRDGGSDGK